MLLLYFLAAGVIVGLLLRGRLANLALVQFRWWPLAFGGLVFQVLLFSEPVAARIGAAGPPLYVASTLAVLVALLRNLDQPGFRVIAVGAALNLAAIVANGGHMPASPEAFTALTGVPAVPTTDYSNSTIASPTTPLAILGDNLVLPRPLPFANVFSIGDVLIGLGATWFMVRQMLHTHPPSSPTVRHEAGPTIRRARRRALSEGLPHARG
jgi:hypothetical protein